MFGYNPNLGRYFFNRINFNWPIKSCEASISGSFNTNPLHAATLIDFMYCLFFIF